MKKRMGRPPLIPGNRRSAKMNVSLLSGEAKKLEAVAKNQGKTFSTWAREVLLAAVNGKRAS